MAEVDVVVVGAGTAGLQAALQLRRVGRSVTVLEKRSKHKSGPRWCNTTLSWQFERAGLQEPAPPELLPSDGRVHMISPDRDRRFVVEDSPMGHTDMRLLVERLRDAGEADGVLMEWGVRQLRLTLQGERPISIDFEVDGERKHLAAKLFVDATGLGAQLRRQVPALDAVCPDVDASDTCSARQMVFAIDSVDGALRFLESEGAAPGDTVDHLGLAGGYSVLNITVEPDLSEVSVLVGTLGGGRYSDASSMVANVRAEHGWIGKPIFGGGGIIPLRRPYARLAVPGLALVGDAACQVMATHGSGIGFGLMAGKVLAESVEGHDDPGGLEATWGYQAAYHREFGAILAGYDVFRRFSTKIDASGVQQLFAAGLFDARLVAPGLHQTMGTIAARDLPDRARSLLTHPNIGRHLVPALLRMQAARVLPRMYPTKPNERALKRWDRLASVCVGESNLVADPPKLAKNF